jgi:hypothetical protein
VSLRIVSLALLAILVLAHSEARAQVLPPPQILPPASMVRGVLPPAGIPMPTLPLAASPFPVPGYRPSAYQVWQNYGVTYNGWLRPAIMQNPFDGYGYWLYNGAPYPYVYTRPGRHMPSIAPVGAPTP